jgi:dihydrofolate reductase
MKHFRAVTMGKPVVMGRKTWDSLNGPLKGRDNIVLTRAANFRADGVWAHASLPAALACARSRALARSVDEIAIIGGAQIYAEALPLADRLYVTDVDADIAGDAHFPVIDPQRWREISVHDAPAGPDDDHPMRFRILERV